MTKDYKTVQPTEHLSLNFMHVKINLMFLTDIHSSLFEEKEQIIQVCILQIDLAYVEEVCQWLGPPVNGLVLLFLLTLRLHFLSISDITHIHARSRVSTEKQNESDTLRPWQEKQKTLRQPCAVNVDEPTLFMWQHWGDDSRLSVGGTNSTAYPYP